MMQQGFQSTAQSPHHAALQAAHGGGSPSGYSHGAHHAHAHSQVPALPNANQMQITLSNSINKGKSGATAGVGGAYGGHAGNGGKVYNTKKNNFAMGALEIMSTRNAPRSLDKYAVEAAQHGNQRQ